MAGSMEILDTRLVEFAEFLQYSPCHIPPLPVQLLRQQQVQQSHSRVLFVFFLPRCPEGHLKADIYFVSSFSQMWSVLQWQNNRVRPNKHKDFEFFVLHQALLSLGSSCSAFLGFPQLDGHSWAGGRGSSHRNRGFHTSSSPSLSSRINSCGFMNSQGQGSCCLMLGFQVPPSLWHPLLPSAFSVCLSQDLMS